MQIAGRPDRRQGEQWPSLMLRIDAAEIKALNDCVKKFIQDAQNTNTMDEINTKLLISMQSEIHKARGILNPS